MVEYYRVTGNTRIIIPEIAKNSDLHRTGIVRFVGNGKLYNSNEIKKPLVQPGDVVLFQVNDFMVATQRYVLDGKEYMQMSQDELIAKLTDPSNISVDNLEMLGDYVLIEPSLKEQDRRIILPELSSADEKSSFIKLHCVKIGSTVDLDIKIGDELIVNFAKLNPLFISTETKDGFVNKEYAYIRKEWINGVVEYENN
jgi:co-chaperonin GroES (HSP10)